jgi:hypothetical protein
VPKKYKKPDLTAPRYRPKKLNLTNTDFYNKFLEENPKYNNLSVNSFKNIISTFNGLIWETALNDRNGIQLPEQLGYIFIGSCPKKKSNVDFKKSEKYGFVLQNQNWESDQHLAKIFYTNYETKYRFKNHDLWGFKGVRDFTRSLGKAYREDWKKYVLVDNMVRVSKIFRKDKIASERKIEIEDLLQNYDEFNLD